MIQVRLASGQISWKWLYVIVFVRLFFALAVQGLIAALFFRSSLSPTQAAGDWWPVYGTLVDLGCFILIIGLIKKEGLHFQDLLNFDRRRLKLDILLGFSFILWVFPLAMAGIIGCSILIFGSPQPPSIYQSLASMGCCLQSADFSFNLEFDRTMHLSGVCSATVRCLVTTFGIRNCNRGFWLGHPAYCPAINV